MAASERAAVYFNPLSPHGERRFFGQQGLGNSPISIHSPRMGRDGGWCNSSRHDGQFQSTLPAWGETRGWRRRGIMHHISIHSPRMGRDAAISKPPETGNHFNPLSPHGERRRHPPPSTSGFYFNPLSPHGERRGEALGLTWAAVFQSTLPAWGETVEIPALPIAVAISIHSPRMGRDFRAARAGISGCISIHSPRMGRDNQTKPKKPTGFNFNPLSPHGERRAEHRQQVAGNSNFNPLSPHGERRTALEQPEKARGISIHSPRMGRDSCATSFQSWLKDFNPLSPHGERPARQHPRQQRRHFNPLSPHGERPLTRAFTAAGC